MKKNNYSAPKMEQVKMEAEQTIMSTSGAGGSSFSTPTIEFQ